ncbi:hypothetical protein DOY81_014633 [Sarcophaga bullata]|nr:hypothetical protein DOY81_014633 [Sarcophaga bullata]
MKKRIIKKNLEIKGLNQSSTLKRYETNEENAFHTDTTVQ